MITLFRCRKAGFAVGAFLVRHIWRKLSVIACLVFSFSNLIIAYDMRSPFFFFRQYYDFWDKNQAPARLTGFCAEQKTVVSTVSLNLPLNLNIVIIMIHSRFILNTAIFEQFILILNVPFIDKLDTITVEENIQINVIKICIKFVSSNYILRT